MFKRKVPSKVFKRSLESYEFLTSKKGFLGLEQKDSVSLKKAKVVIIPFGLESSVSYGGGTHKGPKAMIKASHQVELFDEEQWCEPFRKIGIATMKEPAIGKEVEPALNQLEEIVSTVLESGKFPFVFGGEHSISAGAIRPFAHAYDNLAILHFDAHADLRDGYDGEHYSHAAALRRCLDFKHVSLVSVGIRNISAEEIPFLEKNKKRVHIYWAKDRREWNIDEMVSHLKGRPVYLTFDIDGFDMSVMPATGTPEPGGIFWDDAMDVIRAASKVCNIVGADVNELAPIKQLHGCNFLAAKLAYKILGYAFSKKK